MLVLGIDPGLATTGYGIIRSVGQEEYQTIAYGIITTEAGIPDSERLKILFAALTTLIEDHQPDASAIEKLYFQKNVKTALAVGQARGVALLTLARADLPVYEYNPNEVKQTVCGYGNADKRQVQRMVQTLLHLDDLPKPDDAADALAVAICHIHHQSFNNILQRSHTP
jgi:crossover junction endodeoxyribonuclease RuvC